MQFLTDLQKKNINLKDSIVLEDYNKITLISHDIFRKLNICKALYPSELFILCKNSFECEKNITEYSYIGLYLKETGEIINVGNKDIIQHQANKSLLI